ncbi:hypothetical protein CAPTEDRAFT_190649, partial [Capitella teleta]
LSLTGQISRQTYNILPKAMRYEIAPAELHLDGYQVFKKGINEAGNHGLVIYAANHMDSTELITDLRAKEILWLRIRLLKGESLTLGCFYRNHNSIPENNVEINNAIRTIAQNASNKILIFGDFNYPSISWQTENTQNHA